MYKVFFVEVRKRGYTVLEDFSDTPNPPFFEDLNAVFDLPEDL